jgi:hypothetical protein
MGRAQRPHCGCRNGHGTPKICHATREAAQEVQIKRAMHGGYWEVYPCPVRTDTWHVTGHLPPDKKP